MDTKKKTYTAIDFARYHSGNMEAKEMHALEKAALEDPFLADALEGYMHTESAYEDVQHLKSRLAEKTKDKKVYSIASISQNVWWRIAAIFILIGVAGYFFFDKGKEEGMTIAKNEAAEMKQPVNQLPSYDSPTLAMKSDNQQMKQAPPASEGMQESIPEPDERQRKTIPKKQNMVQKIPENSKGKVSSAPQRNLLAQTKSEDTNIPGDDYARIESKNFHRDREEKLVLSKLNKEDSGKIATPALLSLDTPMMALQSQNATAKSINRKKAELSDLRVTEESQKRSLNQKAGMVLSGKTAGVMITVQSPLQPIEGDPNYYLYIIKNKKEVLDSNDNPVKGRVQLEFSINKEGKPVNIRIVKSDCPLCEKEAISLLENGPLWKGDLQKKGEIIISF